MPVDEMTSTHARTTRIEPYLIARELNEALGPTLVALLAGVKDRKLPNKWALEDGPTPRVDSLRRLQAAHRAWRAITTAEDHHVARAWFIGLNPLLDETPPVVALRDGYERQVLAAAQAFIDSERGGQGAAGEHDNVQSHGAEAG